MLEFVDGAFQVDFGDGIIGDCGRFGGIYDRWGVLKEDSLKGTFVVDLYLRESHRYAGRLGGGGDGELGGDGVADMDLGGGKSVGCGHCHCETLASPASLGI